MAIVVTHDIEAIAAAGLCAGCGLCAALAPAGTIEMHDSIDGYRRPRLVRPLPQREATLIDAVCPGLNIVHTPDEIDVNYHPVWGPIIASRLGWSTDPALRRNASSGGGLSAMLIYLLEIGEIDYVLQTSVSEHSPIRNAIRISTGRDDVFASAGSRYAPSSPLANIDQLLDRPDRFAFVGKPCDVAGLRMLSRHDPRVDEKVRFLFAFMCAGVPSHHGTDAVLSAMGVEDGAEIESFRFRGDGWPGNATAVLTDGRRFAMDYNTSWGTILNRHLQFRCKICPDGTGEFADITFADGWHCDERGYPSFQETKGRSLILTRTRRGEALFARAQAAGHAASEPIVVDVIRFIQPFQAKRKGLVLSRLAAMASIGRIRPRFRRLALVRNTIRLGFSENIRSFLGTLRRLRHS